METRLKKKDKFFQFRVNEEDQQLLNQLAEENDMTVAEVIMRMAKYFKRENLTFTFAPKDMTLTGATISLN